MNHNHGILIFGVCFFMFLAWLWRYDDTAATAGKDLPVHSPEGASESFRADLAAWLKDHDLSDLQQYFLNTLGKKLLFQSNDERSASLTQGYIFPGARSLEDCMHVDMKEMSSFVDAETQSKLDSALHSLHLKLWLRSQDMAEAEVLLREAGYTSLSQLCELSSREEILQVCRRDKVARPLQIYS